MPESGKIRLTINGISVLIVHDDDEPTPQEIARARVVLRSHINVAGKLVMTDPPIKANAPITIEQDIGKVGD